VADANRNHLPRGTTSTKVLTTGCAIFLLPLLLTLPALSYGQQVKDIAPRLADAITKSGKKTVAVVDFTDLQGRVTEFGRFLAEEFSVDLANNAKGFDVIDRTNLKTLLQEHKLAATGIIDPQTARRVGEIAGVQVLVAGTVTPYGESVRLSVKVLDAETARVISGVTADIPRNKAVDELLAKGIATGDQPTAPPPGKTDPPTPQQPTDSTTAEYGDFLFTVLNCSRSGDITGCSGTITNRGSKAEAISIFDVSYLIDNLGNQSAGRWGARRSNVVLGSAGDQATLEPNLPMRFSISGLGLSEDATSVSIVFLGNNWKTTARNLRLRHR
jgi:TolB-like protein